MEEELMLWIVLSVMIYLETSHRDNRIEYNKDKEEKANRHPEPVPIYSLLR